VYFDFHRKVNAMNDSAQERKAWFAWYVERLKIRAAPPDSQPGQLFRCPCCHCRTLPQRGAFTICPVCFWEDDGQDDADADNVRGGPNGALSLSAARANYLQHGACEPKFMPNVRPPRPEEMDLEYSI
jgi:hypothetical protein